jgi:MFS family permease
VSARILEATRVTFQALSVPNYRRYISGQAISLTGTWMQMTAQSWLVLTLTGSSTDLGLIVALQTLPVLLLGPYGGVIADRVDKRRVMVILQTAMGVQALVLGLLTVTGVVTVWEIGVLAALLGLNNAFENPARQSFMSEMVGAENLRNAVTLNSVLVNVARTIGPAVAGILIATVGVGVVLPRQRRELRRGRDIADDARSLAIHPSIPRPGGRPAARGAALHRAHARSSRSRS